MPNDPRNMPGPGDPETWGPVRSTQDPRYTETEPIECEKCSGVGHIPVRIGTDRHYQTTVCPDCEGYGKVFFNNISYLPIPYIED